MDERSIHRIPVQEQESSECVKNFDEVSYGYTPEQAIREASRCLNCRTKPCQKACPVNNDIPGFISRIAGADFRGAYDVLSKTTSLPGICGRVCPHEKQCEGHCTRGIKGDSIAIGELERFTADWQARHQESTIVPPPSNGHRVAVIGSGPSGLSAAGDLALLGYDVTVFEALNVIGGVLIYGIPSFRLPRTAIQAAIEHLKALGVSILTSMVIGKVLTIDDLFNGGYEAIYLATGASKPKFMGVPGENLKGVCTANEFLERINLIPGFRIDAYGVPKNVLVVGGGNTAMDAARSALRLGADSVTVIYRRSRKEMPASGEEVDQAIFEGVIFHTLASPVSFIGDENGYVQRAECVKMKLGEAGADGRRSSSPVDGIEFSLDADMVILALGTEANTTVINGESDIETTEWGCIITEDGNGSTKMNGVFAGGDAVTGPATVVKAMSAGKKAAKAIDAYIMEKEERKARRA